MSLTFFIIFDLVLMASIGFMIWVYCRNSRLSTLNLVATYKLNLRDTERKLQMAITERIARFDLNEKRLNHVESRVGKLSGRSEKTVIKLAEREIARRKRRHKLLEKQMAHLGIVSRKSLERKLIAEKTSLYRQA